MKFVEPELAAKNTWAQNNAGCVKIRKNFVFLEGNCCDVLVSDQLVSQQHLHKLGKKASEPNESTSMVTKVGYRSRDFLRY